MPWIFSYYTHGIHIWQKENNYKRPCISHVMTNRIGKFVEKRSTFTITWSVKNLFFEQFYLFHQTSHARCMAISHLSRHFPSREEDIAHIKSLGYEYYQKKKKKGFGRWLTLLWEVEDPWIDLPKTKGNSFTVSNRMRRIHISWKNLRTSILYHDFPILSGLKSDN